MRVHKVTLMIIDTDDIGAASVEEVIEGTRYPNRCIAPTVMEVETREIDWNEGAHPLNYLDQRDEAFARMFPPPGIT